MPIIFFINCSHTKANSRRLKTFSGVRGTLTHSALFVVFNQMFLLLVLGQSHEELATAFSLKFYTPIKVVHCLPFYLYTTLRHLEAAKDKHLEKFHCLKPIETTCASIFS